MRQEDVDATGQPRDGGRPTFSPSDAYYDYVAAGYDHISDTYDDVEAKNSVGRRLRKRMQVALLETFQPSDRVLDIGCGTGIEAEFLASHGTEVFALDVSEGMVQQTQTRAETAGLTNLTVYRLAAHEVGTLKDEFGPASFDGAYSHGGALNMDPLIDRFVSGLADLVRKDGHFLCTIVNQTSLFEALVYPLFLNPRKGYRRLGNVIPVPITRLDSYRGYVIPARFYSPKAFYSHFADSFQLSALEGLQILGPPWNLSDYWDRLAPLTRLIEAVEDQIARTRPFNSWGSLFLMDLVRGGA